MFLTSAKINADWKKIALLVSITYEQRLGDSSFDTPVTVQYAQAFGAASKVLDGSSTALGQANEGVQFPMDQLGFVPARGDRYTLPNGLRYIVSVVETSDRMLRYRVYGQDATPTGLPPYMTRQPVISGPNGFGTISSQSTLATSNGMWSPTGAPTSYTYQWFSGDATTQTTEVEGATSNTYQIPFGNLGVYYRCHVTGVNDAGELETISSNKLGPVQADFFNQNFDETTTWDAPVGISGGVVAVQVWAAGSNGIPAMGSEGGLGGGSGSYSATALYAVTGGNTYTIDISPMDAGFCGFDGSGVLAQNANGQNAGGISSNNGDVKTAGEDGDAETGSIGGNGGSAPHSGGGGGAGGDGSNAGDGGVPGGGGGGQSGTGGTYGVGGHGRVNLQYTA